MSRPFAAEAAGEVATPRAGSRTFRALRHRNARIYFSGLLVSNVGTWLQLTAMSLLVYDLTGRSTDLGITVALQFLPMLLLGAWSGAFSDRRDKRTLALITQSMLAAQALALGIIVLAGLESVAVIWALTLVLGILNAFENPARRGLVTELVEPRDIPNATSLNTAVMTGSRIFGPALGALLVGSIGAGWCFVLNGVSFLAVLGSLLLVNPAELHAPPLAPHGGTPVRDALAHIRTNAVLARTFIVMAIVSTFTFNYSVSLPKLADVRWGGEGRFGLVLSVMSVGSLIGSLLTARLTTISTRWYLGMTLLLGVAGLALAWAPNLAFALVLAVPVGLGGAGFISSANGITQQESPPDMRGRLMALTAVAFLGSTPIGGPITGFVGDEVSPEWSLAYGSLTALVTVAVVSGALVRSRPAGTR